MNKIKVLSKTRCYLEPQSTKKQNQAQNKIVENAARWKSKYEDASGPVAGKLTLEKTCNIFS